MPTHNSIPDVFPQPDDDEIVTIAQNGHPTSAEEAMDNATAEDGFSDESAYTPSDAEVTEERTDDGDQAT